MNNLNLKKIREEKGITQQELANLLDVSLKTVHNYESGKPIPDKMQQLIRYKFENLTSNDYVNEPETEYHNMRELIKENSLLKKIKELHEDKIHYLEEQLQNCLNSVDSMRQTAS